MALLVPSAVGHPGRLRELAPVPRVLLHAVVQNALVEIGPIRYATSTGGVDIAYQEFGRSDGPRLVFVSGFISHLDLNWEWEPYSALLHGLGAACRVLAFDKRGTGLSGRDLGFGSLAERTDDVLAVMDAAGWERAHFFGVSEGGPISIFFAASHPERASSLSLEGRGSHELKGVPETWQLYAAVGS